MQSHEMLIQAYVDAFVDLTPTNADNLYALVTDDVFFSDPSTKSLVQASKTCSIICLKHVTRRVS